MLTMDNQQMPSSFSISRLLDLSGETITTAKAGTKAVKETGGHESFMAPLVTKPMC